MGSPPPQALIALIAWGPIAFLLFTVFRPRRAVIVAYIAAWLFLPVAHLWVPGLPDISKMTVTSTAILLATFVFDTPRILSFRPRWFDLFALGVVLSPFPTNITNGLGVYSAFSGVMYAGMEWGMPYFIGRIYFNRLDAFRELAVGIVIGGLVYMPLCLYEVRMSPQLNKMVYGYFQHSWIQHRRASGWRPIVFLQHGLMVGMWTATASLASLGMWLSNTRAKLLNTVPYALVAALLIITTLLVKSKGAIVLLFIGIAIMLATRVMKQRWLLLLLVLAPVIYVAPRAVGLWDGLSLVEPAQEFFGPERAASLETRLWSDWVLAARARQQLLFGWGAYGRFQNVGSRQEVGKVIPDSLWVIQFGKYGLLGLISLAGLLLLPVLKFVFSVPPRLWLHPRVAPAFALAVILALWTMDNTLNDMFNPVYIAVSGGLLSLPAVRFREGAGGGVRADNAPVSQAMSMR